MPFVYAKSDGWATQTVFLHRGDIWEAGDAVVQAHPEWFTPDPETIGMVRRSDVSVRPSRPVPARIEQTTADPGEPRHITTPESERRGPSRPRKVADAPQA